MLEAEEADALPVDGDVDILEAGPLAEEGLDRDHVLPVHREVVGDDHPAARPVRRALDVIPGVLRDVDRIRVLGRLGERVRVADRDPANLGGGPQVGLEEGRRETLRVRHVVEGAEVGVRRQPASGLDFEIEEIADYALVLGLVQPLEAPRAGVVVAGGLAVDHGLERLDQGEQRVGRRAALARRRHHPGPQLPDHLLGGRGPLLRRVHDELLQREIPVPETLVVADDAVALDHAGEVRRVCEDRDEDGGEDGREDRGLVLREGRGGRRAGRTVRRGLPHQGERQPQNRGHAQCLQGPILREQRRTIRSSGKVEPPKNRRTEGT